MSGGTLNPGNWVDEYGDYLFRYAFSRLRDREAAEETVQDSFVAALRHVDQYQAKGTERAWLLGILKRKIVDLIRARSRAVTLASDESNDLSDRLFDQSGHWRQSASAGNDAPLDSLEREEFWRILRECLKGLPPRQSDVFVLREMEDQNTEEICKELEISPSNLWVILYRARLQLSSCMQSRWRQDQS